MGAEPVRGVWELEIRSPRPGWRWTVDRMQQSFGRERVYVTGRRPDPLYRYPSGPVVQRLRTAAPSFRSIDLYVAVARFDEKPGETPYTLALRAESASATDGAERPTP